MNHPALQAYLAAVEARNLPALVELTDSDITLILPQGQLLSGRADFVEFHQEWFADPDWKLQADLVRSQADDHTAVFVLNVVYLDKDRSGQLVSFTYYLTLTFVRRGGRWLLVLDQNTPIVP